MGTKVFIMTDLEGVSGVVNFSDYTGKGSKYYEQAKALLTAEVNASVEGAIEAGADEFLVIDGHGAGGLNFNQLHRKASLMMGRPLPLPWKYLKDCDMAFQIGQHAKMGSGGNLEHTYSSLSIHNMWLNDKLVGELEINMLLAGEEGVPCVLVTGDQVAAREACEVVPNIETVKVKDAISQTSAVCISKEKARKKIKKGAERAVERYQDIEPYTVSGPLELKIEYASRSVSSAFKKSCRKEVEQIDNRTIVIRGENIKDIWRAYF